LLIAMLQITPFRPRPGTPEQESRRARLAVAAAIVGIIAALLAYAISPGVRHAVGHAAHSVKHSVGHALDHDSKSTTTQSGVVTIVMARSRHPTLPPGSGLL
jgi:hypothetical protein